MSSALANPNFNEITLCLGFYFAVTRAGHDRCYKPATHALPLAETEYQPHPVLAALKCILMPANCAYHAVAHLAKAIAPPR